MLWKDILNRTSQQLEEAGIDDAFSNAEYLALHVLGFWNKSELRKFLSVEISDDQLRKFESLVARRLAYEPLQHIIGETEFFGLRLFTSPAALIPRPETEILVEEILKVDRDIHSIIDIGTGSGAIALALASRLPDAQILGCDISAEAIALAEKNKARLGIDNVRFKEINIFQEDFGAAYLDSFDIIVSNPPYISIEEFETLDSEVKNFDPRIALTDESDGLLFYRRIAEIARHILRPNGMVFVETGYNGALEVKKIFEDRGLSFLRIVNDLQGIGRVVVAKIGD
jgi:release factor glutamine methyltransferase